MIRPKILIVDDEPFNVDYLEQELEESDIETIAAVNGKDALDKVRSESPDLILLDIMMPVMDGFEVLSRLKANPATRDLPVIVISANSDMSSVIRGIQLGAEDYLPKPFEPALLHARISTSIEKKRLRDLEQLYLKSLERELDIGREIQMSFLPSSLPQVDGWEIAAYFKAAHEVAGDFYDAFLLPDRTLVVLVGDVCGKGVGAALFMTLFRSLIRATLTTDTFNRQAGLQGITPSERLEHAISFTNSYIAETHAEANMFTTLFVGLINLQEGTLTYANCGNEPALLFGEDCVVTALRPTGPVIGLLPDICFSVKEIALAKHDLLLSFTDGLPDALNPDGLSFKSNGLSQALNGFDTNPALLLENIERQLHQFIGTTHQFDDVTLLAIQRLE